MTLSSTDSEHTAWLWLMALPRVPIPDKTPGRKYREMMDRQIKITVCPGKLHTNCGAPLVGVSVLLPNGKRATGLGNSLYVACDRAQSQAWRAGFKWPFLSTFHAECLHGEKP